jgi:hypothetical protein
LNEAATHQSQKQAEIGEDLGNKGELDRRLWTKRTEEEVTRTLAPLFDRYTATE